MTNGDVHALSGAYALDALTDLERAAFRRHLESCATCAIEVAEFQETAARLADGAWSVPPPGLRDRVFAEVSQTRQDRPAAPASRVRPQRSRRLVTVAAAVALAAAAATGTYVVQESRLDDQRAAAQAETARITDVLGAPDATLHAGRATGDVRLTAVVAPSRDEAVLTMTADRPPGTDRVYQLWMVDGDDAVDAGVLAPGATTATRLVSGVAAADAFAVTVEPAGGSAQPTFPTVAEVPLA